MALSMMPPAPTLRGLCDSVFPAGASLTLGGDFIAEMLMLTRLNGGR